MRRLLLALALCFLAALPVCAQTITITGGTFSGTTEPFEASDTANTLTLTNSTGGDIVLIVDRAGPSLYAGMGGVLEVNNAIFPRNHNLSSCFPYAEESVVILSGGTCQFLAYLKPIAAGAVSGDIRVEYVPKTTNQLVSVTLSNGNTRRNIVTSAPVANLQVGYYVTIWGTGADPNSANPTEYPMSYSNTQKVTAVTDSQHFQTENTITGTTAGALTSPMPNPTNGYISDATVNKWATLVTVTGAITGTGAAQPAFDTAHPPTLPTGINADYTGTVMDTTYTAPGACTGATITTASALTTRLAGASCGDVLCVQANTTYSGIFTLPKINACSSYTYLISADYLDPAFPPAGTRVQASDKPHLFTLSSNNQNETLLAAFGAGYWRVVGAELTRPTNNIAGAFGPGFYMSPVFTGPGSVPTQASDLNHHIILDRSWIHRDDADTHDGGVGVEMDGNNLAVIDSRIENMGMQEIQTIANCNGNGPLKIANNYLESTGENIMLGGCDPAVQGSHPQDVEIRNNYLTKRLTWMALYATSTSKNLLEFKTCSRCLIIGNILENNWALGTQNGSALVISPGNQHGGGVSGRVTDITYALNILRHTHNAFNYSTGGFLYETSATRRILVKDMLLQDIGSPVSLTGLTLTVDATAKTITRSSGSWTTDGVNLGNSITFAGFVNAGNNGQFNVASITGGGTIITVVAGSKANGMVNEGPVGSITAVFGKWTTGGWTCNISNTIPSAECGWTLDNLAGASGLLYGPYMPPRDLQFDHVTGFGLHGLYTMSGQAGSVANILTTNNILWESSGINGDGTLPGSASISNWMTSPTFNTNVFLENSTWPYGYPNPFHYPAQNPPTTTGFWFEDSTTIGSNTNLFTDWANCNGGTFSASACALATNSYYKAGGSRQASDNLQVGANISAIVARTACVTSGAGCGLADAPSVLPASINFGDQAIGSSSSPSTVTFTNATGSSITITSANLTSGTNYSRTNNCGTLASNASCTVTVTFTPQAPAGTEADTLTFISSDAYSPHTIALSGNATGAPPNAPVISAFSVSPTSFLTLGSTFTFTLATTGADLGCEEYIQSKGITVDIGAVPCNGTFTFTPPGPFSLDYTSPYSVWVVANGSGGNTQSSTLSVYVQQRVAAAGVPF